MTEDGKLLPDLKIVFNYLHKHKMRLNLQKCAFAIEAKKFLGFMLTYRVIEANLDKCQVILEMKTPTSVKEIQHLLGKIASLLIPSSFSSKNTSPFSRYL